MADLMSPDFALPPTRRRPAVDGDGCREPFGRSASAVAPADRASLLAAGPRVVDAGDTGTGIDRWLPAAVLEDGGWIAWGAVAVDGPIGVPGAARGISQQAVARVELRRRSGADPSREHDHSPLWARAPQRQRRRAGEPDGARHRLPCPRPVHRGEIVAPSLMADEPAQRTNINTSAADRISEWGQVAYDNRRYDEPTRRIR